MDSIPLLDACTQRKVQETLVETNTCTHTQDGRGLTTAAAAVIVTETADQAAGSTITRFFIFRPSNQKRLTHSLTRLSRTRARVGTLPHSSLLRFSGQTFDRRIKRRWPSVPVGSGSHKTRILAQSSAFLRQAVSEAGIRGKNTPGIRAKSKEKRAGRETAGPWNSSSLPSLDSGHYDSMQRK